MDEFGDAVAATAEDGFRPAAVYHRTDIGLFGDSAAHVEGDAADGGGEEWQGQGPAEQFHSRVRLAGVMDGAHVKLQFGQGGNVVGEGGATAEAAHAGHFADAGAAVAYRADPAEAAHQLGGIVAYLFHARSPFRWGGSLRAGRLSRSAVFSTLLLKTCQKKYENSFNNSALMRPSPWYASPEVIANSWVAEVSQPKPVVAPCTRLFGRRGDLTGCIVRANVRGGGHGPALVLTQRPGRLPAMGCQLQEKEGGAGEIEEAEDDGSQQGARQLG